MLNQASQTASSPHSTDSVGVALVGAPLTCATEAQDIASLLLAVVRSTFLPIDDAADEMPVAQLRVCTMLFDGPRTMSNLSRELGISLSAMTQLADRLERANLVKRVFEGTDRRVRCLQLTPRALAIIHNRDQARAQQMAIVLEQIAPTVRDAVRTNLEKLLAACLATKDQRRQIPQTKRIGHSPNGCGRENHSVTPLEC